MAALISSAAGAQQVALEEVVVSARKIAENSLASATLKIRNVGPDFFALAFPPAVAVYVDGVPQTQPGSVFSTMMDIQLIEVLSGPQGTRIKLLWNATDNMEFLLSYYYYADLHSEDNGTGYKGRVPDSTGRTAFYSTYDDYEVYKAVAGFAETR